MKLIDLLNKIANGEEVPKKIKCVDEIFTFNSMEQQYEKGLCDISDYLILDYDSLNEEVEIIEEPKKIEYLNIEKDRYNAELLFSKINEIIDFLNRGDKE